MRIIAEHRVTEKILRLALGDITGRSVDAVVNAANSHLQHGGGVAGAIVKKGGAIIQEESNRIGFTPVGASVITGAGKLSAKFVIHTVGPRMGEGNEEEKLKNAVVSALRLAAEKRLKSISMPAISSGIFGFPKDKCARILVNESADYLRNNPGTSLEIIEFCIFDSATLRHFQNEFENLKQK